MVMRHWVDLVYYTDVHRQFLEAGADIIETNTYQVSLEGFKKYLNLSSGETLQLIKDSVESIARPVCDQWTKETGKRM